MLFDRRKHHSFVSRTISPNSRSVITRFSAASVSLDSQYSNISENGSHRRGNGRLPGDEGRGSYSSCRHKGSPLSCHTASRSAAGLLFFVRTFSMSSGAVCDHLVSTCRSRAPQHLAPALISPRLPADFLTECASATSFPGSRESAFVIQVDGGDFIHLVVAETKRGFMRAGSP